MKYYFEVIKKYAVFSGRARRSEFWYFTLFSTIISLVLNEITLQFFPATDLDGIYTLLIILPSMAVGVRRMHDVGLSGWYYIIPFYSLFIACQPSDFGDNQYGPNPIYGAQENIFGEKLDDNL